MIRTLVLLSVVLLMGCTNESTVIKRGPTQPQQVNDIEVRLKGHVGAYKVVEFEYEGCEYVAFNQGSGLAVAHKGNCKYCQQRNK